MANETYTLIQKTILTASASSITFSSIPQTFTDLVVRVSARVTRAVTASTFVMVFNGVTTGYTDKNLEGNGSTATSNSSSPADIRDMVVPAASATASTFGNTEIYISNYASTTAYKSISIDSVMENNATTSYSNLVAGLWSNNAAITSFVLSEPNGSSNFTQYTTVSLYGVAKYGVTPTGFPKASGGDIITNDGTYWIHQFLNSGTFTPSQTLSCGYLVVAGGGGGGGYIGGGGGSGGLRSTVTTTGGGGSVESALSVTAQSYAITVGAGGAGGADAQGETGDGRDGSNSVFSSITSTAGGGGGGYVRAGKTGGAGGGGSLSSMAGGTGTNSQGYAGGAGGPNSGTTSTAGGGGGSGAVGAVGANSVPGNGGAGVANSISGSSVTYAGGGGGSAHSSFSNTSTGGSGGGGNGGSSSGSAANATANLGGGGGGAGVGRTTGNGGSGIVIIRYAM